MIFKVFSVRYVDPNRDTIVLQQVHGPLPPIYLDVHRFDPRIITQLLRALRHAVHVDIPSPTSQHNYRVLGELLVRASGADI